MTNPKRNMRGLPDLGRAVDERIGAHTGELELRHDTGRALPSPLGGAAGGGGGGTPALPESYVESLKKSGEASALSGAIELAASGDTTLAQSASAPHFTVASPSYTASDGVQRTSDAFSCDATVVRTSGAQSVAGVKTLSDKLCLEEHLEQAETAAPSTPAAGWGATYTKSDGRRYQLDDGGNEHDLTVLHKQCFSGASLANLGSLSGGGGGDGMLWDSAAHPAAAGAMPVNSIPVTSFDFANSELDSHHGHWSWEAEYIAAGSLLLQSQLAVGAAFRKFGDGAGRDGNCRVVLKVRLRVNATANFDSIKLFLNDVDSGGSPQHSVLSSEMLTSMSAGTWHEGTLAAAGTDVGSWESALRAGVIAVGKEWDSEGTYPTSIDIEWLALEQWAN
jgi:hypothetical protein